ncbi:MAG: family 78 glycoside hydrolase catalytic domain, partial [Clostridia bacterium]|nr:family 78 glycoside hydrolase catalytic domain [Clostridia bacterium]
MKFAKWIWENREDHADEYVRFFQTFESNGGDVSIDLSCDSNYELYVNGKLAGFGQYADYPYYKVFDRIDITPYCYAGINHISILVWYFGKGFSTYYKGLPGLIFEISEGDRILAFSSKLTLCRKALDYQSGKQKIITKQLGFSFAYDASMYNGCNCETFEAIGYKPAVEVSRSMWALHIRPIEKLVLKAFKEAKRIQGKHWVYDLGGETVGYLSLRFKSSIHSLVRVSYGEHLVKDENGDDRVPRIISNRDFSVELYGNGEWFEFSNFMRRLGCRYLQVDCDSDVEIESIGLYPVEYPVIVKPFDAKNPLRQKIYDVCVDTLRFCMFEHYEDCPWREQALYNLDSRNQMLCGYYAFDEYLFPKASLELFGRDRRDDGLLHITAPAAESLVIPSFTLFWILQMKEYAEFIGDVSLVETYYTKMKEILNVFFDRQENGLIPNFYGDKQYWNFYEWNPTLQ